MTTDQVKSVIAAVLLTSSLIVTGSLLYSNHASETLLATVVGGILGYITPRGMSNPEPPQS